MLCAAILCLRRQYSGSFLVYEAGLIDENWLREQNELLTISSGAKHTILQMGTALE